MGVGSQGKALGKVYHRDSRVGLGFRVFSWGLGWVLPPPSNSVHTTKIQVLSNCY